MQRRPHEGWIEVICGPMFSGKSEELIRRITRYQIARVPTQTFKPQLDTRYAEGAVVSHSSLSLEAIPVADSAELLQNVESRTRVVGVDEAQFFDLGLVEAAHRLAAAGMQVIVAGLDTDYMRRPFGPVPDLMLGAEYVTKALAVCHSCGGAGMYTQRVIEATGLVVLGAEGSYEARCRRCYQEAEPVQEKLQAAEAH